MDAAATEVQRRMDLREKLLPPLAPLSPTANGGWWPVVRESFTGAWQQNVEVRAEDVLTYSAVYSCISLIAADVAKLALRLVRQDDGIWTETESPAFSPFLRKPNRYQSRIKFVEQWIVSKLARGNTYALKQRDNRGVVVAAYVLSPSRVTPLVTPTGEVYYQVRRDDLSEVLEESIIVPAREMFHDIMCALWHPLIGVSPIYACGHSALQGLSITSNSEKFFANGANPSGMLTAPGAISDPTAVRLAKHFAEGAYSGDNAGKVIVAGDGLKYEQFTMSAVDAQLIEQLKWTAETVCSCFHVPPYMIGVGAPPPYANIAPLIQQYYSQCIQSLLTSMEVCLDEGLGLDSKIEGVQYGTEFDINDLIWMDAGTKIAAAADSVKGSVLTIDESRKTYLGKGPVTGGSSIWMQQQNYSLKALAERDADAPFAKPEPTPPPAAAAAVDDQAQAASFAALVRRKSIEQGLYAA